MIAEFNCLIAAMLITRLHKFLTARTKTLNSRMVFWLSLSLTFAAIYGLLGLQIAFSSKYVVQDDARQHLFWMWRLLDPQLFSNDLLADYFQSVAPLGYTTLYRLFTVVGIDPIVLSKFLPIVLGLITTGYCFGICLQLLPVPMAGFIATLLLNQNMWMGDDLVSATPRAFVYPLFMAFLYYVLRRQRIPCLIARSLYQNCFLPRCYSWKLEFYSCNCGVGKDGCLIYQNAIICFVPLD